MASLLPIFLTIPVTVQAAMFIKIYSSSASFHTLVLVSAVVFTPSSLVNK
jgi:hypothetical protein